MKTTERLAAALQEAGAPDRMIKSALAGVYDDFLSDLIFPIKALVKDCLDLGLTDIANRATDGEFDATKEESDAWAASPEGQSVINEIRSPER